MNIKRFGTGAVGCVVFFVCAYVALAQTMFMPASLRVTLSGAGSGTVSGGSINCGAMCSATVMMGMSVTLTAIADSGSTFAGWSGDCTGSTASCTFSPNMMANVTARFDVASSGGSSGSGSGTGTGTTPTSTPTPTPSPTGTPPPSGTTSTTTPDPTPSGTTSLDSGYPQDVYILKGGTGVGTVSAGPLSCGQTCYSYVDYGTKMIFTAEPADGSVFTGWSGACSGVTKDASCSVTADKQVVVSANFDLIVPKKTIFGISAIGFGSGIKKLPFSGDALGPHWRIGGTSADPLAQGTLTGKGSVTSIRVGLYTGSVFAQFRNRSSGWSASYYSEGQNQRSELYDVTKGLYQEESSVGDDGVPHIVSLFSDGKNAFAKYDSGSLLIVPAGTVPAAPAASWAGVPVPRGTDGSLIPTKKIMDMLAKAGLAVRDAFMAVAHAAVPAPISQAFDRITAYRKTTADMAVIQQKFSAYDFNDPNVDYVAAQTLVDAYLADQNTLDSLIRQLGVMRLFVRAGDWLSAPAGAAAALTDAGFDAVPAALVGQLDGPIDFYAIGADGTPLAGTCTGKNDSTTGEQAECVKRTATAAQTKAALTANAGYISLVSQAHEAAGNIESALFAPAQ